MSIDIMSDTTGKEIVDAIKNSATVNAQKAEIEAKGQEVIGEIEALIETIPDVESELNQHKNNSDVHVSAEEKAIWNDGLSEINSNISNIDKLLNVSKNDGKGISSSDGSIVDSSIYTVSGLIPVSPNTDYVYDVTLSSGDYSIIAFYKKDGTFINRQDRIYDFRTPSECYYLRVMVMTVDYDSGHLYGSDVNNEVNKINEDVEEINESLGNYDANENLLNSYSGSNGFAIQDGKLGYVNKGTYKLSYKISDIYSTCEIQLTNSLGENIYTKISGITIGEIDEIIEITSSTDVYMSVYTTGTITISDIHLTLQNIANEVVQLKNDFSNLPDIIDISQIKIGGDTLDIYGTDGKRYSIKIDAVNK